MIIQQKDNFVPETPDISIVLRTLKCFQPGGFFNSRANQPFLRMLENFQPVLVHWLIMGFAMGSLGVGGTLCGPTVAFIYRRQIFSSGLKCVEV